jgi:hypothetical protein
MKTTDTNVEPVTMSDVLELASWERPRSDAELDAFISRRESFISSIQE